jgi:hypothetical protein
MPDVLDREERDDHTLVTVRDYDALDRTLRYTPTDKSSKPIVVRFIEANGNTRYIVPPRYHDDGTCCGSALELIYDETTGALLHTHTYTETVAKHVIRVKQANGYDYPLIIYGIKERDLKDDQFMRGVLFDEWEPYLMREKAK